MNQFTNHLPEEVHQAVRLLSAYIDAQETNIDALYDSEVIDDDTQDFLMAQVARADESLWDLFDNLREVTRRHDTVGLPTFGA